jgi:hypothetical protein
LGDNQTEERAKKINKGFGFGDFEFDLNLRAKFFRKPWPRGFSYSTNNIIKAISALDCLERID